MNRRRLSGHEIYQKYRGKIKTTCYRNNIYVGDIYTDGTYLIQVTSINTTTSRVFGKYINIINPKNTNITENDIKGHPIDFFPESKGYKWTRYYGNVQCENTRIDFKNNNNCNSKIKYKKINYKENPQCDF